MKRQIITYAGDKEGLHKFLKVLTSKEEMSMNRTVMGLIQYLKDNPKILKEIKKNK